MKNMLNWVALAAFDLYAKLAIAGVHLLTKDPVPSPVLGAWRTMQDEQPIATLSEMLLYCPQRPANALLIRLLFPWAALLRLAESRNPRERQEVSKVAYPID